MTIFALMGNEKAVTAMAEYIEREAALALVRPDAPEDEKAAVTIATAKKLVRGIVQRAPTADVAPVVRCENCRYAMWVEWAKKYSCGQVRGLLVFGDHFCAFGKREYESRPQASL